MLAHFVGFMASSVCIFRLFIYGLYQNTKELYICVDAINRAIS